MRNRTVDVHRTVDTDRTSLESFALTIWWKLPEYLSGTTFALNIDSLIFRAG